MGGDGDSGADLGLAGGPQDDLLRRGNPALVAGDLDDPGLDAGAFDPNLDLSDIRSAMTSGARSRNGRGTARWLPVAAMMCTPVALETSRIISTSRPRSMVLTSMMVRSPSR